MACLYGVTFWLPSIVKGFGVSIAATGWISAIPYIAGFLGMVWWGLRSDKRGERTYHLAGALLIAESGPGRKRRRGGLHHFARFLLRR